MFSSDLISTLSLKERVDFAVGDALEYLEDKTLASDKISLYKYTDISYYYNIDM